MKRPEFAKIMLYLETACGKSIPVEAVEIYFDLLGDLAIDVLQTAARRVALEHPWATFPSAAEIRSAAGEILRGLVKEMTPAEAWEMAWRAAGSIDLEIEGSTERHLGKLPAIVQEAMRAYSISDLVYGKEPVCVVRAQFLKIYEQLVARDRRHALLPAAMKDKIVEIGKRPDAIQKTLSSIGVIGE